MKNKILLRTTRWLILPLFFLLFTAVGMVSQALEPDPTACNATVVTDKDDYAPGETVIITGTGWLPGETVELHFIHIEPGMPDHEHTPKPVIADALGNILFYWLVLEQELGTSFRLEAHGLTSECYAETFFTDGNAITITSVSQTGVVYTGVGGTVTYTTTAARDGANNSFTTTLIANNLPTGVSASFSPSTLTFAGGDSPKTFTLTLTVLSSVSAGNYNFSVTGSSGNPTSFSLVVSGCSIPTINTQPSNQTITYGSDASFSVVASGTAPLTYQWQVDIGSGFTDVTNGAIHSGANTATLSLTKPTVELSGYKYRVVVTNSCGNATSNGNATLTVNARPITITADAKSKTYGEADPALTYQITSGSIVSGDSPTGALNRVAGENVGSYTIQKNTLTFGSNYAETFVAANLTINQLAVTVTADAKSKTYGDVDPALTFVSSPAVGDVLANGEVIAFTGALSRVAGEDVGTYAIEQNTVANSNYAISYTGALLTINQLAVTVTAQAKEKYCGQVDPALTFVSNPAIGTVLPNNQVIGFTGSLTRDIGEIVGFYNILQGSVTNSNYAITYIGAMLEIIGVSIDASASSTPVALGSPATLKATVTPAVAGVSVTFTVYDDLNVSVYTATVQTDVSGYASAIVPAASLKLGVFRVEAVAGSGCSSSIAYIPVYDASGSFVTGGGWIFSPEGALVGTTITGKANFGFNAQYKKGKNNVLDLEGNTNFQFSEGDFHFKSSSYEAMTLVISGPKATYRGVGTVNGTGDYGFMVTAIDGQISGGGGLDKFRIKIWNRSNGNTVVYDNELGKFENENASTVLGGGSIVIHEVKKKAGEIEIQMGDVAETSVRAYPNPFSERVFFDLQFAKDANAMLEIFDLRGAKLATLLNHRVEAGQQYRLEYTPMDVVPGMLMYRLMVDGEVMNGRILYQKQR